MTAKTSAPRLSGLWRNADFMRLWVGQTISEMGSRITRDGLPYAALLVLGATPAQMGLLAAAGSAPILLFGLVAGVWVDRLRRRPIMIAADVGRAALLVTIPLAALLGWLNLAQLYIVTALAGILTVFFDVAYLSYLPELVERENIVEGNSKLALSGSIAEFSGPPLAGFLVQVLSAPIAILFDALSFLFSAASILIIRKPEAPASDQAHLSFGQEALEGMRAVMGRPVLRALALTTGTRSFFGNFLAGLYGLFAIRVLGLGPAALGLIIAMGGVGDLLAATLNQRFVRRWRLGPTILSAALLTGVLSFLTPLAGGPPLVAAAFLIAGQLVGDMAATIYEINAVSLRQIVTPDRLMGRTNASMRLLAEGVAPLGALVGGLLGSWIGVREAILISAAGRLLSILWLLLSPIPRLREHSAAIIEPPPQKDTPQN